MEITNKNIKIKQDSYSKLWRHGLRSSQTRLLSDLDYKKGWLKMVLLEPKAWVIRTTEHYKAAKLAIDLKKMHLVDQMDLHRKTGEMIFIKLTIITSNACKLENMVSNVTN